MITRLPHGHMHDRFIWGAAAATLRIPYRCLAA